MTNPTRSRQGIFRETSIDRQVRESAETSARRRAAGVALLDVAGEADTLTQNVSGLLRGYSDDVWAQELLAQVEALGNNARAAITQATGWTV